jgi:BirA family biotin operon repressor/biotin-[acetyl-CoA-carboxylase] ligase
VREGTVIAFPLLRLGEVDSTNRYALQHIDMFPDRQIIVADRQTAGYGRLGRTWVSHLPGNLYMSVILKPAKPPEDSSIFPSLSLYASLRLCELLLEYGIDARIKWPNDVLVNGRKMAGILGEASFRGERFMGYVLGLGVNLNMDSRDLKSIDRPATSVNLTVGREVDREAFLNRLIQAFFSGYEGFLVRGFSMIRHEYMKKSSLLGKPIVVTVSGCSYSGKALSFSRGGALVMIADTGERMTLAAGEVSQLRSST